VGQRRHAVLGAVVVLVVALTGTGLAAQPFAQSAAGLPTRTAPLSSAWLPYWDFDDAYARVTAHSDLFSTVSPFWYAASSCGQITGLPGAGSQTAIDGLRGRGLAVVPTITSAMGPQEAADCFGDPAARAAHVEQVVALATSRSYAGVEFNYESLALTTDPAMAERVRDGFSAFATDACGALHAALKSCVMTVMPRTDDSTSVWRSKLIPAVYDYAVLGAVADTVRVMAYDQHAPNTGPGPIAGYPWVRAIAEYTRSKIPPHKVELGIPLYGRDWAPGSGTDTDTAPAALAKAARYGATVSWDDEQHAPRFSYTRDGISHEVWFSDARSVGDRLHLARAYGFRAAYWAPGQEDSETWRVVRDGSQALFTDIQGDPHEHAITRVAQAGIATGYDDGTFRSTAPVTRAQMAAFLTRALHLPPSSVPAPYRDIGDTVHVAAIASVSAAGIATGYPDQTFHPHEVVTRAQMAAFLTRALGLEPSPSSAFTDVAGDTHEAAILSVAHAGIAGGYSDGTFRPAQPVTRGQLASFLTRALGL
jgi:spore germination protein YaaH